MKQREKDIIIKHQNEASVNSQDNFKEGRKYLKE